MQYAIELYYDKETEHKLFDLAKRVAEEKCIKKLNEFAQSHKRMPAYSGSIGMFNDTKTIFV